MELLKRLQWSTLALLGVFAGCDGTQDEPSATAGAGGGASVGDGDGVSVGAGGMGGGVRQDAAVVSQVTAGKGALPVREPAPTPGGDTSDLGTSGRASPPCSGDVAETEIVPLDDPRALAFAPDHGLLAKIEGVFEADVVWQDRDDVRFADPQAHARIDVAGDGTGTVVAWACGGADSCYAGNFLAFNVRISIATSDGRMNGSFVASLNPDGRGGYIPGIRGPDIWLWDNAGEVRMMASDNDGSSVVGPSLLELLGSDTGNASIIITQARDREPRIEIEAYDGLAVALPLDQCPAGADFLAEAPPSPNLCQPWRFMGPGYCCYRDYVGAVGATYPTTAGTDMSCSARGDADQDAGTDGAESDGGG